MAIQNVCSLVLGQSSPGFTFRADEGGVKQVRRAHPQCLQFSAAWFLELSAQLAQEPGADEGGAKATQPAQHPLRRRLMTTPHDDGCILARQKSLHPQSTVQSASALRNE